MYSKIVNESKNMIDEFLSVVPMNRGEILVIGCSTSEIIGSDRQMFRMVFDDSERKDGRIIFINGFPDLVRTHIQILHLQ